MLSLLLWVLLNPARENTATRSGSLCLGRCIVRYILAVTPLEKIAVTNLKEQ